jgi:hypothetical protein
VYTTKHSLDIEHSLLNSSLTKAIKMKKKSSTDSDYGASSKQRMGMRTIQRNRRGPMTRDRYIRTSVGVEGDYDDSSSLTPQKQNKNRNLTTHMDHDDNEILIESTLGNNNYSNNNEHQSLLKSRKHKIPKKDDNSYSGGGSRFIRRRNYAPLSGYDILSDEERTSFSHQSSESLFALPDCMKGYKKLFLRVMMIVWGVSIYFLTVSLMKNHHVRGANLTEKLGPKEQKGIRNKKPSETDVDIKKLLGKKILDLKDDNTLDMGYHNGQDDDMVDQEIERIRSRSNSKGSTNIDENKSKDKQDLPSSDGKVSKDTAPNAGNKNEVKKVDLSDKDTNDNKDINDNKDTNENDKKDANDVHDNNAISSNQSKSTGGYHIIEDDDMTNQEVERIKAHSKSEGDSNNDKDKSDANVVNDTTQTKKKDGEADTSNTQAKNEKANKEASTSSRS